MAGDYTKVVRKEKMIGISLQIFNNIHQTTQSITKIHYEDN